MTVQAKAEVDDLDWIRRALEKPGKTQTGLAAALGRSPTAVTQILKGKRLLKLREIKAIAEYLEADPPPLVIDEPMHRYPSRHTPGTHWATDQAWEILDRLPPGMLPDDWRFLTAGMIAGALMKAVTERDNASHRRTASEQR